MTHLLPPNLLRLFAPRPALPFAKPLDRNPDRPVDKESQFTGIAELFAHIKQQADDAETIRMTESKPNGDAMEGVKTEKGEEGEMEEKKRPKLKRLPKPAKQKKIAPTQRSKHKKPKIHGPKPVPAPTKLEEDAAKRGLQLTEQVKVEARAEERKERKEARLKRNAGDFDPAKDPNATGDPYKTLFISRLTDDTTEEDLRKDFDMYGRIEKLTLVRDISNGKSKKYAFILYEREKDMKAAYKDADGLKIKGKRILVDVERGRTVKGWKPMRLGGGLGGQPKPVVPEFNRFGGRGRGGFRGGFSDRGGGFRGRGGGAFGPPRGGAFAPRGGAFDGGRSQGGFGPDQGGGGFNGPPNGNAFGQGQGPPRGQGIGYGQGPPQGPPQNAFGMPAGGYGPPGGAFGEKRSYDSGPPRDSYDRGYDDRDSKRPRY